MLVGINSIFHFIKSVMLSHLCLFCMDVPLHNIICVCMIPEKDPPVRVWFKSIGALLCFLYCDFTSECDHIMYVGCFSCHSMIRCLFNCGGWRLPFLILRLKLHPPLTLRRNIWDAYFVAMYITKDSCHEQRSIVDVKLQ